MIEISKKQDIALQLKHGVGYIEYSQSKTIDPDGAYGYARDVIEGPWPLAEKVIAGYSTSAFNYAFCIIGGPWPLGEAAIASDPEWAFYYAKYVIKGPWSPGEVVIFSNTFWKQKYQGFLNTLC